MVVGTLSLKQKGQMRGHSGCSMHWIQYALDAVHSGIVVYGGGDIVFGAKRSNQWMQWMQYAVDAVHSGGSIQGMQYAVELWYMVVGKLSLVQNGQTRGHSGCSMYWMQYAVE